MKVCAQAEKQSGIFTAARGLLKAIWREWQRMYRPDCFCVSSIVWRLEYEEDCKG